MARLFTLLSYFHFCLASTLLIVAALVVPENAFADTGDCADYCQKKCATNSDPYTCGMSCNSYCNNSCDNCKYFPQDKTNCEIDCAYGNAQKKDCITDMKNDLTCNGPDCNTLSVPPNGTICVSAKLEATGIKCLTTNPCAACSCKIQEVKIAGDVKGKICLCWR